VRRSWGRQDLPGRPEGTPRAKAAALGAGRSVGDRRGDGGRRLRGWVALRREALAAPGSRAPRRSGVCGKVPASPCPVIGLWPTLVAGTPSGNRLGGAAPGIWRSPGALESPNSGGPRDQARRTRTGRAGTRARGKVPICSLSRMARTPRRLTIRRPAAWAFSSGNLTREA
jgi:hypothetical protein